MQNKKHNPANSRFKAWLLTHRWSLLQSLRQFSRNPVGGSLTTAVIGVSLALPGGFYLFLENVQQAIADWDNNVQITAFLIPELNDNAVDDVLQRLSEHPRIASVTAIHRDQALAEYKALSGFSEIIDLLDKNPLPTTLVITPDLPNFIEAHERQLVKFLDDQPEIDVAHFDQQWIKRLHGIMQIVRHCIVIFSIFIGFGVLLIIGNTIRMSIYHRRHEIEIVKLFGATNQFIRRPFLYSGFWYGLSGGVVAFIALILTLKFLNPPVTRLAALYASEFRLVGFDGVETLILPCVGVLLGLCGSWISVQRHLNDIEPI